MLPKRGPRRERAGIVADILRAWLRDRGAWEDLQRGLDGIDVESESRKIVGISGAMRGAVWEARANHGEALLPFCWEQILKFPEEQPFWMRRHAALHVISQVPRPKSLAALFWCVDEAEDPHMLDGAHQAILHLPFKPDVEMLKARRSRHRMRDFVYEDLLAREKPVKGESP